MFRSSTIIRELALNLAKVIFTLKHWETLAKLVSYNMVKNKVSLILTTPYENILFPLYLSLPNFNCFILVYHFISH